MKHYVCHSVTLFIIFCSSIAMGQNLKKEIHQQYSPPVTPEFQWKLHHPESDHILPIISLISETSIAGTVRGLEEFGTRHSSQANRFSIANWIANQFRGGGITDVVLDSFQMNNAWQVNIIATIPGMINPEKEIIIGAHYDSRSNNDLNAPGADDNASGTAAVIEMARVMMKAGYKPNVTVRFAAFAAEEAGMVGSDHYAAQAADDERHIILMQNYDMIGHRLSSQTDRNVDIIWYPGAEKEARLDSTLKRLYTTLTPIMSTNYRSQSDSWPFFTNGYKAVFNIESDLSPYYHTTNDLSTKIDFSYATEIIKSSMALLLTVDDGELTAYKNVSGIPDLLPFGRVNIGYPETLSVTMKNISSADPLTITSMTINHPSVSMVPVNIAIPKDTIGTFRIICAPTSAENITATLLILSNDPSAPQKTVTITAAAQIGASIAVAPDSLFQSLYSGHSATRTFTIQNTGGSDLSYAITMLSDVPKFSTSAVAAAPKIIQKETDPESFKNTKMTGSPSLRPDETRGVAISKAEVAVSASPVGLFYENFESAALQNWEKGSTIGTREITSETAAKGLFSYHYSNAVSGEHYNGISRTFLPEIRPKSISFYIQSATNDLAGGYFILTDESGAECIWFYASYNGAYYVNNDIQGDNSYQYKALEWNKIELSNIDWENSVFDYSVNGKIVKEKISMRNAHPNASLGTLQLYNYDATEVWFDAIDIGGKGEWVFYDSPAGTISPGTQKEITVTFSPRNLVGGEYNAAMSITCDDPANPRITIPIKMLVTDAPTLSADTTLLDFGEIFLGDSSTLQLTIQNTGSQDLLIFNATVQSSHFRSTPPYASIDPGEEEVFTITLFPDSVKNYSGTLLLKSNDIVTEFTTITLRGKGVEPPVLSLSDDTLQVAVDQGTAVTHQLTIHNNGKSDLRLTITGGSSSTNRALQFNGSTSYVECQNTPSVNSTESLTIEAWIYPFDWNGNRRILQKGYNDNQYRLLAEWGRFVFDVNGVVGGRLETPLPSTNQWHHCAGVFNFQKNTLQLYFDGVKVNERSNVSGHMATTSDKLFIGTKHPSSTQGDFFHGIIDEVRLWNIARDSASIRKFMNVPLDGTESGLMAYWQFEEGSGSIARDKTVNANHGTLFESTAWSETAPPMLPGWLFVSPSSGTCAPGTSIQIECTFDATEKDTGLYSSAIIVQSNDPLRKSIVIPVQLKVAHTTGVNSVSGIPLEFALFQNYPNPFNPSTTIRYAIPAAGTNARSSHRVILKIFDLLGREIETLVDEEQTAGWKEVQWNAAGNASGIYVYRIQASNYTNVKKMIILK